MNYEIDISYLAHFSFCYIFFIIKIQIINIIQYQKNNFMKIGIISLEVSNDTNRNDTKIIHDIYKP